MKTTNFDGIIIPFKNDEEKLSNILTTRKTRIEHEFPFVQECVRRRMQHCKESLVLAVTNNTVFIADEHAAYYDEGHFSKPAYKAMKSFLSKSSWEEVNAFEAQQAAKAIRKYSDKLDTSFEVAMEICLCGDKNEFA